MVLGNNYNILYVLITTFRNKDSKIFYSNKILTTFFFHFIMFNQIYLKFLH